MLLSRPELLGMLTIFPARLRGCRSVRIGVLGALFIDPVGSLGFGYFAAHWPDHPADRCFHGGCRSPPALRHPDRNQFLSCCADLAGCAASSCSCSSEFLLLEKKTRTAAGSFCHRSISKDRGRGRCRHALSLTQSVGPDFSQMHQAPEIRAEERSGISPCVAGRQNAGSVLLAFARLDRVRPHRGSLFGLPRQQSLPFIVLGQQVKTVSDKRVDAAFR